MMNEHGKSDSCVISARLPNKDFKTAHVLRSAEAMEKRQLAKGNLREQNIHRIQCRERVQSALERIRAAAVKNKEQKFTALIHHIYSVDILEEAFYSLKRNVATGIDGVTWGQYAETLTENLEGLAQRVKRGAYRAKPVKRTYIPKADGKQRPLGVLVLEDKIVQYAATLVLNAIYETDFLGFSYGYRPGRSQHNCLDALYVALQTKKVNYVLDANIQGFFDRIWSICDQQQNQTWIGKAGEFQFSWIHPHCGEEGKQWDACDYPQIQQEEIASEAARSQSRTAQTDARSYSQSWGVVEVCCWRVQPVFWSAYESELAVCVSVSDWEILASHA